MKLNYLILIIVLSGTLFIIAAFGFKSASAYVAASTNYRIERDSINTGGLRDSSANYIEESTAGEVATGRLTSTSYILLAGYQQVDASTTISISIDSPSDVLLSPNILTTGGSAEGSGAWTVTTNSSTGYTLSILASTNPALTSGGNSFTNYTPAGSVPDYSWSVVSSEKEFGFTPEGVDVASTYKDDGSVCAAGSATSSSTCWDSITTSNKTIATRSSTATGGVQTSVRFRAEAGSASSPSVGIYDAVVTATALAI